MPEAVTAIVVLYHVTTEEEWTWYAKGGREERCDTDDHLRVMGTTAELDLRPRLTGDQFCDECGLCISECPAGAISDTSFQGLQCRAYRAARGEYEPHGPDGLLPYCKRCIWICPIGEQPVPRQTC